MYFRSQASSGARPRLFSLSFPWGQQVMSPMEDQPHPLSSQRRKTAASGGGVKTQLSKLKEDQDADSDSLIGGYVHVHILSIGLSMAMAMASIHHANL